MEEQRGRPNGLVSRISVVPMLAERAGGRCSSRKRLESGGGKANELSSERN